MERLTLELVMAAATRLSVHYPNSGHSPESMKTICEDWLMDFNAARIHPQLFGNMVLLARRRCKFFPTIAEMMDFCRELRAIEQRKAMEFKALPEPEMSEEVSEQGIARIRKLFELAESGMTIEEMENEMVRFVSDN